MNFAPVRHITLDEGLLTYGGSRPYRRKKEVDMAREEKTEQAAAPEGTPKKKASLWKWIIIGVVAAGIVGGGAGGYYFFAKKKGETKTVEAVKPAIGQLWPMDPFIVNLTDNNGERYLKLVMQLEVSGKDCAAELDQLTPKLRDSVLDLLSAKSYSDIMGISAKQRLRDEITMRINRFLSTGEVVKVYFTELVIQ